MYKVLGFVCWVVDCDFGVVFRVVFLFVLNCDGYYVLFVYFEFGYIFEGEVFCLIDQRLWQQDFFLYGVVWVDFQKQVVLVIFWMIFRGQLEIVIFGN